MIDYEMVDVREADYINLEYQETGKIRVVSYRPDRGTQTVFDVKDVPIRKDTLLVSRIKDKTIHLYLYLDGTYLVTSQHKDGPEVDEIETLDLIKAEREIAALTSYYILC